MKSTDIYQKVLEKLPKKANSNQLEETNTIEEIEQVLIEYTNEKIFEEDIKGDYVEELGVMFDLLEQAFESKEQKNQFFANYIQVILNILSNNGTGKIFFWSKEERKNNQKYPRMQYIDETLCFFKTEQNSSNKGNAIWLFDYIKKENQLLKKEVKEKKKIIDID